MKFFNKKSLTFSSVLTGKDESTLKAKAFTLAELITSMVIISILVLIVFVFTTANIENLASNTVQVATVEGGLSLEETFSGFRDRGFTSWEIIEINPGVNPNQALLLKTPNNKNGVLFGIVNANSGTLQRYHEYGNNFIGYLELTGVDAVTSTGVFLNLNFPEGNLFRNLRARDFWLTEYHNGELLDIYISIIRTLDKDVIGTLDASFDKLGDDILVAEFNLVY